MFNKIAENVSSKCIASYLPDGKHTRDKVSNMLFETPTIIEWQDGKSGQNFIVNYSNCSVEKGQACLNQLIVNMLLSLPANSIKLHFIDLAFSAQIY